MAHGHAMMMMIIIIMMIMIMMTLMTMISWPMAAETACGRDGG
jgi:hypothetical protein